jgi:hypothetical protein
VLGKVIFCLSENSVSEREVRTHNVGTNYSVQERRDALVDEAIRSLNISSKTAGQDCRTRCGQVGVGGVVCVVWDWRV